jgi:diguanylate cyclase (GGDEF)-like protein/PAS domain S-box-containing protein
LARRLKNILLEAIVESTRDGVVVVDARKRDLPVVFVNPAFEQMTGYDAEEIAAGGLSRLQGDDRRQRAIKEMRDAIDAGRTCEVLLRNYRKNGQLFWNQLRLVPVEDNGELAWWVGIARDVGDLREMQDRLKNQRKALDEARTELPEDRLTGLKTRQYFDNLLVREWSICQREQRSITMFLFDLDFFDTYNETFGRRAGDTCLRLVARSIRSSFRRGGDVVARYEGQRFGCFASGMEAAPAVQFAGEICRRVRDLCIHHPRSPGGRYITASCGVVTVTPDQEGDLDELLFACEAALSRAKAVGGNTASE